MFTPIYLLPQFKSSERKKYQDRWTDIDKADLRAKVLEMIRNGAGEDFLQAEFEHGRMGFLEDMWDLKGLGMFNEDITFPENDTFEGIEFSYARFYHCMFKKATFQCHFGFSYIYNCEFIDCVFNANSFYGATFDLVRFIDCDFFEHQNTFVNCALSEVIFKNCFMPNCLFINCQFDENTEIDTPILRPLHMKEESVIFDNKQLSGIYKGIKEAYASGNAIKKAPDYYYKQMQSITRYNLTMRRDKICGYSLEFIAGYGVKPIRVLIALGCLFLFSLLWFSRTVGLSDGLILTCGALFTFGAYVESLRGLNVFYKVLYVITSFGGIALFALFITVLANLWLREK